MNNAVVSMILSFGLLLFPFPIGADTPPFCAPLVVSLSFPEEATSGDKQTLDLILREEGTCSAPSSRTDAIIVKAMIFNVGDETYTIPSDCLPRIEIDLFSIKIENTQPFSLRFSLLGDPREVAIYHIDGQFICRQEE